ncbi:MAG TPA: helix-turn-helix domain-containing protein [Candidatus Dormibacteraeota bacterium]
MEERDEAAVAQLSTLRALVDALGSTVLEVAAAPRGMDVELSGGLIIHDPAEQLEAGPGDLVVAIGLVPSPEASRLLSDLAGAGVAGLVVKRQVGGSNLGLHARHAGIALLTVPPGSAWAQVVLLLSSALARVDFGVGGERLSGLDSHDLFAVANVIGELVNAPITIEDTRSRVLAFSSRQEEADAARAASILGRKVPDEYMARLQGRGVFRRLLTERGVVHAEDIAPDVIPRAAVAIRAGDEVLGSIWVATRRPLRLEQEQQLIQAANFVALHLLRHRLAAGEDTILEKELVGTILRGGDLAHDAARRLNLLAAGYRVIAVKVDGEGAPGAGTTALNRCQNLLALHLSSVSGRTATALIDGVAYAIVPVPAHPSGLRSSLLRAAEQFVAGAAKLTRTRVVAALGDEVAGVDAIPGSRESADEVLRVLLTARRDLTVADLADVRASVLLQRFANVCEDGPALGASPLAILQEHDRRYHTAHVATCRAYLDAFGDVDAAARILDIHPNTVRYRLRQIRELPGVQLDDPTERLALMLELRLL